ncbi:tetratricopeptide repeat protein [Paraburkholderia tagetis]|uniref:protein O-GlcNAc transferase n=1 Tax=Paraburkholderia tagetis TaxID=2913261 RepID=A0A9X1UGI8_9BURK|nr:tetratricopeptide repeat protein [Paraburkholderia tagetis]MCG5075535.1 tetratricopeptide repeat protein [Paraburkholderia tagetis]
MSQIYDDALAAWRAGQLAVAEQHCHTLLAHSPGHAPALHLRTLIAHQQGRAAEAEALLHEALAPHQDAQRLVDLASALRTQGRIDDTRAALRRALALDPTLADAHFYLANTFGPDDAAQADAHLRAAICLDPALAEAHNNLGNLLRTTRPAEARAAFERAIALRPDFMHAHFNLGTLLASTRPETTDATEATETAETALRRALELDPSFAPAWNRLGRLLSGQRPDEAETALRRAIALNPELAAAHFNLGNLLCERRPDEAAQALRRAVAIKPDFAVAWVNLSHTLAKTHPEEAEAAARKAVALAPGLADAHYNLGTLIGVAHPDEAIEALRRAVALQPDHRLAWHHLGLVLKGERLHEAEAALRRAIALDAADPAGHAALGNVLLDMGRLDESVASYQEAIALANAQDPGDSGSGSGSNNDHVVAHCDLIFALAFQTDDPQALLDECRRFAARYEPPVLEAARAQPHLAQPSPESDLAHGRRLRIGYVSPDFRSHCQALFTVPLLSRHDRAAFEIVCYASVAKPDAMTQHLKTLVDVWRDVHTLDDAALAQQIRDDRIDILVDLTMHMAAGRRLLFARRPAPVQVAWLAYPGTTGSTAMDYRLTDPWLDPADEPGRDALYSERSLRLPDAFWCYDAQVAGLAVNALPAAGGAPFTFGCLNNPAKISDHALRLWSGVLAAVPHARLLLLAPPGVPRETLKARARAQGIDPERVMFVGQQARSLYLETYHRIDVALDSFPYNGHTTSLDASWMGVPVVTRTGRSAASRGGWSIAANLGMPELVAHTDEDFVRIAVELAHDLPRLAALRAGLRARMEASPLMDAPRFAANIESAYRRMWRAYCDDLSDG